jgi:tape measure domain-containing protein
VGQPIDTASVEIVPDFSQFGTLLRRELDSAMREFAARVERAFDQVEREASRTGTELGREINQGAEVAERGLRELDRTAQHSLGSVQRESRQAAGALAGIGAVAGKLGLAAGAAAGAASLGLLGAFGLKTAAALEQTQVAFNSLLGSVREGQRVFNELKQFAALTPFELTDLTGVAQRFLAFNDVVGIADDQLLGFLTTLGNIASVTAAGAFGMERVALALGQIASTGKVTLDNVNQINDALPGFSGIAAIAAAKGLTLGEATQAISAGSISARDGILALLAGMDKFPGAAGAMEAQSQTLIGVFSTFKDNVSQSLAGAFEPVLPQIKQALTDLTPVLSEAAGAIAVPLGGTLTETLSGLIPIIKPLGVLIADILKALNPFIAILGGVVGSILQALVPVFDALVPALVELAPPIADIVEALAPLLPVLSDLLVIVIKVVAAIVKFAAINLIVPIVQLISLGLSLVVASLKELWRWLSSQDWGGIFASIGGWFADAWHAIEDFFGAFTSTIKAIPQKAKEAFTALRDHVAERIANVIANVKALPQRLLAGLGNIGSLLIDKGKDLIRGFFNGIMSLSGWLTTKIRSFVNDTIIGTFTKALGISSPSTVMADEVGRWLPPGIALGAQDAMPDLVNSIDSMLGTARDAVGVPGGGITDARTLGQVVISPGAIVIQFGTVPTEEQARATGAAVMSGIVSRASQRQTAAAAAKAT